MAYFECLNNDNNSNQLLSFDSTAEKVMILTDAKSVSDNPNTSIKLYNDLLNNTYCKKYYNSYDSCGYLISNSGFSIGCFVYIGSYPSSDSPIFSIGADGSGKHGYGVAIKSSGYIYIVGTSSSGTITATYKLPLNTWTHIFITHNSSTLKLYINGYLHSSYSYSMISDTDPDIYIGKYPWSTTCSITTYIRDFIASQNVYDDSTIELLYNITRK